MLKVLSFSLDPQMLDPGSTTATRGRGYGEQLERYVVVVPASEAARVTLSDKVEVYSTGGYGKLRKMINLYRLGRRLLKENQFDVVSTQDPYYVGLVGYILAKQFKCGFEIQILGLYHLNFLRIMLAKWLLPRADSMRILSQGLKDRLLSSEFGLKREDNMHVVPIYADVSKLGFDEANLSPEDRKKFQEAKETFNDKYKNNFNFLTVGRLVEVKNHSLQFKAIAKLKETHPHVLLHVVGEGEKREELQREVAALAIEDQVIFHGAKYHIELGSFFTQSDCFVLSSDSEGWAMVVIEAATAGLPIVMTDVGCAGSAIIHEKSGLIVPVGDMKALMGAMQRIIEDDSLRESLKQGALMAIKNIATFEEIVAGCLRSWQMAANKTK